VIVDAFPARRPIRARDLSFGMRFLVVVSRRKILADVVYVRRRRFGEQRVVLRRVDTGRVLDRPRSIEELLPAT
jgi:hypothetical protein